MKIAVTYENGEIFQHFGHTEQFKIYTVENGQVTGSDLVNTLGSGHGALAGFLQRAPLASKQLPISARRHIVFLLEFTVEIAGIFIAHTEDHIVDRKIRLRQ